MWKQDKIQVNGEVFEYWMKQYDTAHSTASMAVGSPS